MKFPATNIEVSNFNHIVFMRKAHYVRAHDLNGEYWYRADDQGFLTARDLVPHEVMVQKLKRIAKRPNKSGVRIVISGDYINIVPKERRTKR